jgi:hypothetical protein
MPVIIFLWPTTTRFLYATLLLSLCTLTTLAQEPATTAPPATVNEISSNSQSSEAPLYPSHDIRDKSLIAQALADDAQWLETEHGMILALYRPTEAKTTHGILILFHASEDPQAWPPILENLRAFLPRYGWETLAITLPQKYPAIVPERSSSSSASAATNANMAVEAESTDTTTPESASNSSASPSSSSASSIVARDLLIQAYVNAGLEFVKGKGQLNAVILADNSSVYLVSQTLTPHIQLNERDSTTLDGPLQALVITNLQNQEPIGKMELEEIFLPPQLPILDIFFSPDNAGQTESRDLHRAVAMRKKMDHYQQLLMEIQPKLTEQDDQSYLLGRVRGFMQRQAGGTEVKNSPDDKQER